MTCQPQQQKQHQKQQYNRVAKAIEYLAEHFQQQPTLADVARHVSWSPQHLQRVFTAMAGISPKKFLQHLSLQHARRQLQDPQRSLLDTALDCGLSGTGRLHDLFVSLQAMTPGEYGAGGANLTIDYSISKSLFGELLTASTPRGICSLSFGSEEDGLRSLRREYPAAQLREHRAALHEEAVHIIAGSSCPGQSLQLHLRASRFQIQVWRCLLDVAPGRLTSYSALATRLGQPGAARAVGRAVATNPVAVLIPCHRVLRRSGELGGYRWGTDRKRAMLAWEAARNN